ncbi:hypothetical protein HDV57DRAFT_505605 [Trichoderma longibrachiatum]
MMTPSKQKVEGQGCKVYSKERYGSGDDEEGSAKTQFLPASSGGVGSCTQPRGRIYGRCTTASRLCSGTGSH